jgi:hypothetical protein
MDLIEGMMRERFSALVDKAQELSYKEYEKRLTGYSREDLFNQIFAELIVRECADICITEGESYKYSFTPSKARLAESTSKHCAVMLKKYFGIE